MKNATGHIDWNRTEEHAKTLGTANLHYAIRDLQDTLSVADANDRIDEGTRGGYYRDVISVYRKVLESSP